MTTQPQERGIEPPIDSAFLDELVDRLQVWSGACLSPEDAAATGPLITALLRNAAYAIDRLRAQRSPREVALEKALRKCRAVLHGTPRLSEIDAAAREADAALSPAQKEKST